MITLHTNKGTRNFDSAAEAAEWLESLQPSSVDVSVAGSTRVTIDRDGAWDADRSVKIVDDAAYLCRMGGAPFLTAEGVRQVAAAFGVDAATARELVAKAFERD